MIRFLIFFFLLTLTLKAQIINFTEEKYIDAIGKSTLRKGVLEISDNNVKLRYKDSTKILINKDDELFIKDGQNIEKLDLKKQVALKTIFLLIKSIYNENYKRFDQFFNIKLTNGIYELTPKEELRDYIYLIKFKKNKKLQFLTIYMKNKNETTIRENDD